MTINIVIIISKLTIDSLVHIHMHVNSRFQKPRGTQNIMDCHGNL